MTHGKNALVVKWPSLIVKSRQMAKKKVWNNWLHDKESKYFFGSKKILLNKWNKHENTLLGLVHISTLNLISGLPYSIKFLFCKVRVVKLRKYFKVGKKI